LSIYLKIRDRSSYEFALVSVAVALQLDGSTIRDARLALGGIATKPWRARRAEQILLRAQAQRASFLQAAREELSAAVPRKLNAFKIELAQRTIVRALEMVSAMGGNI
jgi:xanthine dehydrogenase YagS FAD-binding subunit